MGISWHNDAEEEGSQIPVRMLCLGGTRTFSIWKVRRDWQRRLQKPFAEWEEVTESGDLVEMPIGFHEEGAYRHAILAQKQFAAARISLTFRSPDLSPTSPWTPLTYPAPRVFCMKAGHAYPKDAEYVGCKTTRGQVREGTVFGNALDPLKRRGVVLENGRKNEHIAGEELPPEKREAKFRAYAMEKLKDPAFRREAEKLRGKHLLCWCVQNGQKRSEFCHARVWLDLVNNLPVVTGEGR